MSCDWGQLETGRLATQRLRGSENGKTFFGYGNRDGRETEDGERINNQQPLRQAQGKQQGTPKFQVMTNGDPSTGLRAGG